MVFSSNVFLFAFLPLVLGLYLLLPGVRTRNALLLAASLVFYAWGEGALVAVLAASIAVNWLFGRAVAGARGERGRRAAVAGAVVANLSLLGFFKYANFAVANWNALAQGAGLPPVHFEPVHLPIGISFFTFQAITYVVDVYRGDAPVQRGPLRVALYVSLFPQLVAGPIVRYRRIAEQLVARRTDLAAAAEGAQRFVVGLGKKVLVANTLAVPADAIFALPPGELPAGVAWLGALCYALQIYFDFSGYTDMAIGIGRILGFDFPENFFHPYMSRSLREFWRRWHVTLSTWFRDYLYVPLGGSRGSAWRTRANLLLVFLLCGLWHGASWTFVAWGLFHGFFLALERTRFGDALVRAPSLLARGYALGVVLAGWVVFRAESFPHALGYLAAMVGLGEGDALRHPLGLYLNAEVGLALAAGLLGSTTLPRDAARRLDTAARGAAARVALVTGRAAFQQAVLWACAMALAAGTHNPFIYFRF